MFNKQVVLIVGAGASFDKYGLPLGHELASGIAKDTDFRFEHIVNRPVQGDADLFDSIIYTRFSHDPNKVHLYTEAGHKLSAALGSTISVDDALYQLSEYPEAVHLGKICVMRSILKAERNSNLRMDPRREELEPDAGKDGWIQQIFSMAIQGFRHSDIKHAFKRITFINFNYDRCIEQYLFSALLRVGLSFEDASETVLNLNIIRPYGTLGSILPGSPTFLKFGATPDHKIFDMTARIRTFTETDTLHDKELLSQALLGASLIMFLGFGFHPQNLELMTLSAHQQLRRAKVLATVFGIDNANFPELKSMLHRMLRVENDMVETHPMTASEIFQKLRIKIGIATG